MCLNEYLEKGIVKSAKAIGDFENEKATIKSVGDNWFKRTLSTEVFVNKISLTLGSTTDDKIIPNWEGATNNSCDIFIIPTEVILQELSLKIQFSLKHE